MILVASVVLVASASCAPSILHAGNAAIRYVCDWAYLNIALRLIQAIFGTN
jgi:hypothetical protein